MVDPGRDHDDAIAADTRLLHHDRRDASDSTTIMSARRQTKRSIARGSGTETELLAAGRGLGRPGPMEVDDQWATPSVVEGEWQRSVESEVRVDDVGANRRPARGPGEGEEPRPEWRVVVRHRVHTRRRVRRRPDHHGLGVAPQAADGSRT